MSLYLKYRPRDFESLVGQEFVKETLKKAVSSNRTVGAYLFCGPRGTGKTSTARIFTKAINCENNKDGNPCNNCNICKSIDDESLVDVIEIDAASNTGVDNIREIIEKAQYKPSIAKYKVYIIDEVHMLSKGAFNALLKILEEPPEYLKFILATTETHKVPETIISRCQRYDFRNISLNDIKNRLKFVAEKEDIKIDEKSLDYIAKNSSGALRNALSLFEQLAVNKEIKYEDILKNLGIVNDDFLSNFLEKLKNKEKTIIEDYEELIKEGKNIKLFFKELIFYTKEKTIELIKNNKEISDYLFILEILDETFSKTKNSLDENTTFLIGILKILNGSSFKMDNNYVQKNSTIKNKIIQDKNTKKKEELQIDDIGDIFGENSQENIEANDIIDIFGEEENLGGNTFNDNSFSENIDDNSENLGNIFEEKTKISSNNANFDKNQFFEKLKENKVKGLIIASLKQSDIKLEQNEFIIKFKTNFVLKQFNNSENIVILQKVLNEMGYSDVRINLIN